MSGASRVRGLLFGTAGTTRSALRNAPQDDEPGRPEDAQVGSRICIEGYEIRRSALGEGVRAAQPSACPPGAGAERVVGRGEPGQHGDLGADQTVREVAAGVGPRVDRDARLVRGAERLDPTRVQRADVRSVTGKLRLPGSGVGLEVL